MFRDAARLLRSLTTLLGGKMFLLFTENEKTEIAGLLRNSTITDELSDSEVKIISALFDVRNYKSGEVIDKSKPDERPGHLYILAHGGIDVNIESGDGESIIHVNKPGDLAGMITFVGGAASQISATLYAVGATKVLSLDRGEFENMINSHPMIVYRVMRGVARNMHGIVRRANSQTTELSNYIYRTNGRY